MAPGRIHALLGENGAGKSTLVAIASGQLRPDTADILRDGRAVTWTSPRQARAEGVTLVPQHDLLVDNATVAENLALLDPMAPFFESKRKRRDRVARAESLFGLPLPPPEDLASSLPVGSRQRVEIAGALLTGPSVLILDEPTAVLSPPEVQTLLQALRTLSESGTAVLVITHRLAEVFEAADDLTVLCRGETVLTRRVEEVTPPEVAALILAGSEGGSRDEVMAGLSETDSRKIEPPRRAATSGQLEEDLVLEVRALATLDSKVPSASLELKPGEALTLLAIDGNGADSFAAAIAGLRPATGSVRVAGAPVALGDPGSYHDAGGAVIPADRRLEGLFPNLTLTENFAVSDRRRGFWLTRKSLEEDARARMSRFSIRASGPEARTRELSGGNQQKVLLARALTPLPKLLIAIHPSRGLDLGSSASVRGFLRDALEEGTAVLIVTSDPDEARLLGAPIRVMYRGRLSRVLDPETPVAELGRYMAGLAE
ncbi:MAG: Fructose import ATP-binding protein FruK [Thermoanaerobaculia bacterium]|nr:Fructose import ATP-binding protein FruK [Thermoanaerobaculia bacterium]